MAEDSDVLWGMYQEHTTQGRHHESQRSTMTNLVVAICSGVLGLIAFDETPSLVHLLLSVFLVALGLFGALFSAKHYERFSMHMQRARGYRSSLEQILPSTNLKGIKDTADKRAKREFPRLFEIRLFWFWIAVHLLVAVVGVILAAWVVAKLQVAA